MNNKKPDIVALIPAREGSKRVNGKNIRLLAGHPLIAYTISAAFESEIFSKVIVSTNSNEIATIAKRYGAEVPFLRPEEYASDLSPDIEWVAYTLNKLEEMNYVYQCFSILRPTSPFRKLETIQRAWEEFLFGKKADSLRAIEKCTQHPGKMWVIEEEFMKPLLVSPDERPWHSMPYQALPEVYVQNASLEIAWSKTVFESGTISGNIIKHFITEGYEGFDINNQLDWEMAERLVEKGAVVLPHLNTELIRG